MPSELITLLNEPTYSFGSLDNTRSYPYEHLLDGEYEPTSIHGIFLNEQPLVVFGDIGGCSSIHNHSLVFHNGAYYLAVGRHIVKFLSNPFVFIWSLKVDDATCFGVYACLERNILLSHGELEICRFTEEGKLLWSESGADIFSEGFVLQAEWVEVIDFNNRVYHFDYDSGKSKV